PLETTMDSQVPVDDQNAVPRRTSVQIQAVAVAVVGDLRSSAGLGWNIGRWKRHRQSASESCPLQVEAGQAAGLRTTAVARVIRMHRVRVILVGVDHSRNVIREQRTSSLAVVVL